MRWPRNVSSLVRFRPGRALGGSRYKGKKEPLLAARRAQCLYDEYGAGRRLDDDAWVLKTGLFSADDALGSGQEEGHRSIGTVARASAVQHSTSPCFAKPDVPDVG